MEETIKKVIRLFNSPDKWGKGTLARKYKKGAVVIVNTNSKEAKCFCLAGGYYRVGGPYGDLDRFAQALGFPTRHAMFKWNDAKHRTFDQIKDRLKKALKDVRLNRNAESGTVVAP